MPLLAPDGPKFDARAAGADCDNCPLNKRKPITPDVQPSKLVLVGESPGAAEAEDGRPFVGKTGQWLDKVLLAAGVQRQQTHITNAVLCQPHHKMKKQQWSQAVRCCAPRLAGEIGEGRVIYAMGEWAYKAVGGDAKSFSKWRGAVQVIRGNTVIAYNHPTFSAFYQPWHTENFRRMLARAAHLAAGMKPDWAWPKPILYPSSEALAVLERLSKAPLIGVDIENRFDGTITAIGLASETDAVCLPWEAYRAAGVPVQGITEYPTGEACRDLVVRILEDPNIPKTLQNGTHDQLYLSRKGITLRGFTFDTLLASVVENHRLPHDLQYLVAMEFPVDPWKAWFHEKAGSDMNDLPEEELRWYCLCDSYATIRLAKVLQSRLPHIWLGAERLADYHNKAQIGLKMRQRGLSVDLAAVEEHHQAAERDRSWAAGLASQLLDENGFYAYLAKQPAFKKRLRKRDGPPTPELARRAAPFNPGSEQQVAQALYGLWGLPVSRRTDGDAPSTDDKALAEHMEEHPGVVRVFCQAILAYRQWDKVIGTYLNNMPSGGRLFPIWKPHGTLTERWSAGMEHADGRGFSIQTIPRSLRNCFVAEPGCWLLCADYSQLELRIIALFAGDEELLQAYATDSDVHRLNAAVLFERPPEQITSSQRSLAKTLVYAMNYGAKTQSIWERLRADGLGVSLAFVETVRQRWYASHPAIKEWQNKTLEQARKDMFIVKPLSGRKIFYFGEPQELTITDTSNHPVQGTGADIMDPAFLAIHRALSGTPSRYLVIHAHDEAVVNTDEPFLDAQIMKQHMEQIWTYGTHKMHFPIEFKIGKNWRDGRPIKSLEELKAYGKDQDLDR